MNQKLPSSSLSIAELLWLVATVSSIFIRIALFTQTGLLTRVLHTSEAECIRLPGYGMLRFGGSIPGPRRRRCTGQLDLQPAGLESGHRRPGKLFRDLRPRPEIRGLPVRERPLPLRRVWIRVESCDGIWSRLRRKVNNIFLNLIITHNEAS